MKPVRLRDLEPSIAEELNIPLEHVKKVNHFMWGKIKEDLIYFRYNNVDVKHIGFFAMSLNQAKRLRDIYKHTTRPWHNLAAYREKKIPLSKFQRYMKADNLRRRVYELESFFYNRQIVKKNNKLKYEWNLEKQKQNIGGDQK
jgi:hypothetical protein